MSDAPTAPQTRVCSKCGKEYPLTAEYWGKLHGKFIARCKACCRKYRREWCAANREKVRESCREYRAANLERERERSREYNRKNLKRIREYAREYARENRERIREYAREYRAVNREIISVEKQRYRAQSLGLLAEYTMSDWQRALDYFHGCCAVCGRPLRDLFGTHTASKDHWIPLSSPDCPGTIPANIVPLCHGVDGCNNRKNATMPDEWLQRQYGKRKAAAILRRIAEFFEWVESVQVEDVA